MQPDDAVKRILALRELTREAAPTRAWAASAGAAQGGAVMIESFAARHRLKSRKDIDGTTIIPGRLGHIYEYDDAELGICLLLKSSRAWGFAQRRLVAAGFVVRQRGDAEGCATFDPGNDVQARRAISEAKLRPKRLPTAVQLQNLAKGQSTRFSPATADASGR